MADSEAKKRYDKENLMRTTIAFSKKANPDIVEWLTKKPEDVTTNAYIMNALKEYIKTQK